MSMTKLGLCNQQPDLLMEIGYDAIQWLMNINKHDLVRISSSLVIECVILGGTLSNLEHEFVEEGEGEREGEGEGESVDSTFTSIPALVSLSESSSSSRRWSYLTEKPRMNSYLI